MRIDEVKIGDDLFYLLEQGLHVKPIPVKVIGKGGKRVVTRDQIFGMRRIVGANKLRRSADER